MDAFYTHKPKFMIPNLTKVAKDALASKEAFEDWASVPQSLEHSVLKIGPTQAIYFLGKLDSLVDQLKALTGRGRIETTDGSGLSIATLNGITLSSNKQIGAFFKATFSGKRSTIDLNKLRQKKLTIVCVYNSNTRTLAEPEVPRILNLINSELHYADLGTRLSNMRAAAIRRVQGERVGAYNNLVESLNM